MGNGDRRIATTAGRPQHDRARQPVGYHPIERRDRGRHGARGQRPRIDEGPAIVAAAPAVAMLGVEMLGLSIVSIQPTPEMARALEAEAREALQRLADEAIYARRNAAVEQERRIRKSELNTQIAVEEKQRQIRETQMAAEIAVEEQRTALIDRRLESLMPSGGVIFSDGVEADFLRFDSGAIARVGVAPERARLVVS
jgi:hypothetical protein